MLDHMSHTCCNLSFIFSDREACVGWKQSQYLAYAFARGQQSDVRVNIESVKRNELVELWFGIWSYYTWNEHIEAYRYKVVVQY